MGEEAEEERRRLKEEAIAMEAQENKESKADTPPPVPEKVDIFEQIRRELEKIKEEDEKMKVQIEKDRKKKELLKQIQDEITKIKTVDNTLQTLDPVETS